MEEKNNSICSKAFSTECPSCVGDYAQQCMCPQWHTVSRAGELIEAIEAIDQLHSIFSVFTALKFIDNVYSDDDDTHEGDSIYNKAFMDSLSNIYT